MLPGCAAPCQRALSWLKVAESAHPDQHCRFSRIGFLFTQALMAAASVQPGTAEAVLSVWAMARGAAGNAATDSQQLPMFGTADGLEGVIKRLLAIMQV
jgi:hypothetical protein